mmetsp:Transcript_7708/g.47718  ORF Transcript_7708/g.47718 Transcript_7708/m.47718 type:complete len:115 (-) Transcript_7708:48-392(-)
MQRRLVWWPSLNRRSRPIFLRWWKTVHAVESWYDEPPLDDVTRFDSKAKKDRERTFERGSGNNKGLLIDPTDGSPLPARTQDSESNGNWTAQMHEACKWLYEQDQGDKCLSWFC